MKNTARERKGVILATAIASLILLIAAGPRMVESGETFGPLDETSTTTTSETTTTSSESTTSTMLVCGDIAIEQDCQSSGCYWCGMCSNFQLNTYSADRCVDTFQDCTYTGCNMDNCGAGCNTNDDCTGQCSGNVGYYNGTCQSSCSCSWASSIDCSGLNNWNDTASTQWLNATECVEKEQLQQEYLVFTCMDTNAQISCDHSANETRWVETETTRNLPYDTECTDGTCQTGVCVTTTTILSPLISNCRFDRVEVVGCNPTYSPELCMQIVNFSSDVTQTSNPLDQFFVRLYVNEGDKVPAVNGTNSWLWNTSSTPNLFGNLSITCVVNDSTGLASESWGWYINIINPDSLTTTTTVETTTTMEITITTTTSGTTPTSLGDTGGGAGGSSSGGLSALKPTCFDGIQNGDETGVDCGGKSCNPCVTTTIKKTPTTTLATNPGGGRGLPATLPKNAPTTLSPGPLKNPVKTKALFDVLLKLASNRIAVGDNLSFTATFMNFGTNITDILIDYYVADLGGAVKQRVSENLSVRIQETVSKNMTLPGINEGRYNLHCTIKYGDNLSATAQSSFTVVKRQEPKPEIPLWLAGVGGALGLALITIFIRAGLKRINKKDNGNHHVVHKISCDSIVCASGGVHTE